MCKALENPKKTKLLILVFLCFTAHSWAQQSGFNYKAIIKDNLGNVVANQTINVQLQIIQGGIPVYLETHTPTTDANGLVVLSIGNGTTTDDFSSINWSNQNHNLNVQIDIGSGLVNMGAFQFKTVPYSKFALNADNVNGLEAIDEGNGVGWRLIGKNPVKHGNIGANAIDVTFSNIDSETRGASGFASFAANARTTASGKNSFAAGTETIAAGDTSFAAGVTTIASGARSTAFGSITTASGIASSAFGNGTKAESVNSFALGMFNNGGGNPQSLVGTDPLFEIGNGSADNDRSNALTVYKNGVININDAYNLPTDDGLAGQVLTAVGDGTTIWFPITNDNSTGLEAINEGNGIGWRFKDKNPANYGNIGANSVDLSQSNSSSSTKGATGLNAISTGFNTTASGNYSTAMGFNSSASNIYATAIGNEASATADNAIALGRLTVASGGSAVALGSQTTASNIGATAMGSATVASGRSATATGRFTRAQAFSGVAIGRYNIGNGNSGSWVNTDPLFEIGNGSADNDRSNALTVYKNGTVNINDAYNLPQSDGTAGQVLTALGNGNTQWSAVDTSVPALVDVVNYGTDYGAFGLDLEEPRFYIDKNKVQIEGYMRKDFGTGDINVDDILFVLPIGYRPLKKHMFLCPQISGRNLLVSVNPDGSVIAEGDSSSQFIALNSISFRID